MIRTVLAAVILALIAAPIAIAATASINAAKANCIVGERIDGYLGIVDESRASDEVRREVARINQQRKAAYTRLAQQNGVTIEDTGRVAAEQLINRAGSGQCVQNSGGAWVRR